MNRFLIWLAAFFPLGEITVLIDGGQAVCKRGKVRSLMLDDLASLAVECEIDFACIQVTRGRGGGFHVRLYGIPREHQQRFRNLWNATAF